MNTTANILRKILKDSNVKLKGLTKKQKVEKTFKAIEKIGEWQSKETHRQTYLEPANYFLFYTRNKNDKIQDQIANENNWQFDNIKWLLKILGIESVKDI